MKVIVGVLQEIIYTNLNKDTLPILNHHPCNQDQQNNPRRPYALHAFHLHLHPFIPQVILFSILHLDTLVVFS